MTTSTLGVADLFSILGAKGIERQLRRVGGGGTRIGLADRASQWLVLAAVGVGVLTFAVWYWWIGQSLLFALKHFAVPDPGVVFLYDEAHAKTGLLATQENA